MIDDDFDFGDHPNWYHTLNGNWCSQWDSKKVSWIKTYKHTIGAKKGSCPKTTCNTMTTGNVLEADNDYRVLEYVH